MSERRAPVFFFPTTLFLCAAAVAQQPSDCRLPWPEAEAAQRLGWLRPQGAAAWTIQAVELDGCDEAGRRRVRLWLEPPQKWSRLGISYRQPLERLLTSEGRAADAGAQVAFRPLRKSDVENLEACLAVRRFAERFSPVEAVAKPETVGVAIHLRGRLPGGAAGERPELGLLLADTRRDPVESYRIPSIAALPGRRELLRFAELLSDLHPRCRAVWVQAQRQENAVPPGTGEGQAAPAANDSNGARRCKFPLGDCLEAAFRLEGRLAGPGCPESFSATVDEQLIASPVP